MDYDEMFETMSTSLVLALDRFDLETLHLEWLPTYAKISAFLGKKLPEDTQLFTKVGWFGVLGSVFRACLIMTREAFSTVMTALNGVTEDALRA